VTITLGLLLLIAGFLAWKMRGAQMPHLVLGALIMKASTAGSMVDQLGATGIQVVQTLASALSTAFGGGAIV
jgi:hypothetical protein